MKPSKQVIMVEPTYYDIEYAINPYMKTSSGELKKIDKLKAKNQWMQLKDKLEELEVKIHVIPAVKGLPDMVFAANQSFNFFKPKSLTPTALMARMRSEKRQPEVKYFEQWYRTHGFEIEYLQSSLYFEGNGDALLHPTKNILLGGHGPRTDKEVYSEISSRWGFEVLTLELIRPEFYHLDTCVAILDDSHVVIQPEAFTREDLGKIQRVFENVIEIDIQENLEFFSANCFSVNGKDIVLQKGSKKLIQKLKAHDFSIHEIDTSEFIKAGGSVFCMKMELYPIAQK